VLLSTIRLRSAFRSPGSGGLLLISCPLFFFREKVFFSPRDGGPLPGMAARDALVVKGAAAPLVESVVGSDRSIGQAAGWRGACPRQRQQVREAMVTGNWWF
jgi:hypothetical protein